jgi:hypothetical protein
VDANGERIVTGGAEGVVEFASHAWTLRFGCRPGRRPEWRLEEDGRVQRAFGLPEMTYPELMARISPPAPFPEARWLARQAVAALGEAPGRLPPPEHPIGPRSASAVERR